jgi:YidC/Oxa1 family membrane protein insertase
MQQNDNNSFMDSRTITALVLVGLVWLGWQSYLSKKYPSSQQKQENVSLETQKTQTVNTNSADVKINDTKVVVIDGQDKPKSQVEEKLQSFEDDFLKLDISNQGLAVKNLSFKKYSERDGQPIVFNNIGQGNFETLLGNQTIFFNIEQKGPGEFLGTYKDQSVSITKKITIKDYTLITEVLIDAVSGAALPEIKTTLNDKKRVLGESHFWAPSLETQSLLVLHSEGDTNASFYVGKDDTNILQPRMSIASLNTHYFSQAIIDKSEIIPDFSVNHRPSDESINGYVIYKPSGESKSLKLNYSAFIGPKDLSLLSSVDSNLTKVISFGFFSSIAKPMLMAMKWFYSIMGNWGFSIILLTLLVRMIVMPLHIMSFRSMKTMQKIQPMIQSLREKYKDDSVSLNREMMDLMKKNKVNPLSGCLPMLLQIPVFFALYSVFGQSIELYKAPFIFWIKDLSSMDPYYVLPILMAIVMYLQQKMTPSNMDPAQAKVMQFLPLVFSFMMLTLPSALTLYIFVSTLFGITQQYFFLRDKHSMTTKEVKA